MTVIKSVLKFLVICYHSLAKYCYLMWLPFSFFAICFGWILTDVNQYIQHFQDLISIGDYKASSFEAWVAYVLYGACFGGPMLVYLKDRGVCMFEGKNIYNRVIFTYKLFNTKNYTVRSVCFDLCLFIFIFGDICKIYTIIFTNL